MPLYEYAVPDASGECPNCGQGHFEILQSMADEPLAQCPACGAACHRLIGGVSGKVGEGDKLAPKNLEKHGFTQYRKAGDGVYEKTAGKGPRTIKRDGGQ